MRHNNREGVIIKVLVTGVAGFIGSSVAERLLSEGVDVLGIDAFKDYYARDIKAKNLERLTGPRFTFIEGDLNHLPLADLLGGVDAIIHLAGQPGVRRSWGSDFETYSRDNIDATQKLLEAAREKTELRRFVYGSSSSVYGQAETYPTTEQTPTRPFSPYGVTKLAGEHLATLYRENFGVPSVSFRFFTVYGPRQRPDMAFSRFLRAALAGDPITVFGDGSQIRDFTYVGDIVAALVAAVHHEGDLPSVMNLSGGSSVSVMEALDVVAAVSGQKLNLSYQGAMDGDVTRTGGSAAAALSALGWQPRMDFQGGLAAQFEWFQHS